MHIGQYACVTYYLYVEEKQWPKMRRALKKELPEGWKVNGQLTRGYIRFKCHGVEEFGKFTPELREFYQPKLNLIHRK